MKNIQMQFKNTDLRSLKYRIKFKEAVKGMIYETFLHSFFCRLFQPFLTDSIRLLNRRQASFFLCWVTWR